MTGGTGVLGREVVPRLRDAGAAVRVLSRRADPDVPDGVTAVRGDLTTGDGLAGAVAGAGVIVHCASNAGFGDVAADVASTRRLAEAAESGGPHLVYVSIVGVDRARYGYYRAKRAAERVVEGSGLPWTVLRATQFHDLAYMMVALLGRSPVVPIPAGFRADPVDVRDVADRLTALALAEPAGRAPDLGGPRTMTFREAAEIYLRASGRRRFILDVPFPGKFGADFRGGVNLLGSGDGPTERADRTFEDYVRDRVSADGGRTLPYSLRR